MQNPFEDLIPAQNQQSQNATQENPFSDLIPAQNNVSRGTVAASNVPSITDRAMTSFLHQQSPLGPTKNYDPEANNLSLPERIGNFGVDVAAGMMPFQMGAGALMKYGGKFSPMFAKFMQKDPYFASSAIENALAGGAYDKAQGGSGASGAILGAISPLPSAATNAALKYGAEKVAQSAIPGLTQRATDYMKNLLSPNDYSAALKSNFQKTFNENTANWNKVDEAAAALDNSMQNNASTPGAIVKQGQPISTFDNTPYLNYIDDYVNKISNLEPARREEYSQALDFADKARDMAPQSVQGAVAAYKNINQALKEFMGSKGAPAVNRQAKQFVGGLKDNLQQNMSNDLMDSQMKNLGYDQSFTNIWNDANQSHANLQNFYKVPNRFGTSTEKKDFKAAMQDPNTNEGAIIGQYAPNPGQTGTEGLDQLSNVMGSKKTAQDAVQSYMSRRPLTNGVSTLDVSNEYAKLSPAQRDWIYGNSPQGKLLDTVNNVRQAFGKEPARSLLTAGTHHALSLGAPAALGYFGSELAGGDREQNLLTAASLMGGAGIGKYLSRRLSPGSVQSLVNYAQRSPSNYGRYFNMPLQTAIGGNNQ